MDMKSIKKYYFIISFGIFLLHSLESLAQEPIWAVAVSGSSFEHTVDADLDSNGNLFMIGHGTGPDMSINDSTYFANGDGDAFIAKFSANQELLWFRTLGGNDNDKGLDVHVDDNDDVIILVEAAGNNFNYNGDILAGVNSSGQYGGEGVMIKIDNDGNYLWHDHGSVSSSFQNVVTDTNGNIYLTGFFSGSTTLGDSTELINPTDGTTRDMFVAKYSSAGTLLWAKNVGGVVHNSFAYGHNIAIDELSNKIVIIGRFSKDVFFETATLSYDSYSTFIVAYDYDGTELWTTRAFSMGNSYCQGLDISPNGLIGIAGFNSLGPNPSGLVGFYDLNGSILSEKVYFSPEYCRINSLEFNQAGESFIAGRFKESVTFGSAPNGITLNDNASGFLLKLNINQEPVWANKIPSSFETKVTCKNNRIFYACRTDEPFVYNYGTELISNDSGDGILAEIVDNSCAPVLGTDIQTGCNSYTWLDGNTYTSDNNSATYNIVGGSVDGCDSLVTLDLTIKDLNLSVTQTDFSLIAHETEVSYQWFNCATMTPVAEANDQIFTTDLSGEYAVALISDGCQDTSACYAIMAVGIVGNDFGKELLLYPNPTAGNFTLDLGENHDAVTIILRDIRGRMIQSKTYQERQLLNLKFDEPAGIYLLEVESEHKKAIIRLVIE